MKKILNLLCIAFLLLISCFSFNTYADSLEYGFIRDTVLVEKNQEFTIEYFVDASIGLKSVSGKIEYDSTKIEIIEANSDFVKNFDLVNRTFSISSEDAVRILSISFKCKLKEELSNGETSKIVVDNVSIVDSADLSSSIDSRMILVKGNDDSSNNKIPSSNSNLTKVEYTGCGSSECLINKKDESSYSITVPYSMASTEIKGYPEDSNSSVTGNGKVDLKIGINNFELVVTAEDGSSSKYSILIDRIDDRSSDNTIKNLELGNNTIGQSQISVSANDTFVYNKDYSDKTIDIKIFLSDSKAIVTGNNIKAIQDGAYGCTLYLKNGENKFNFDVTAENGSKKTYSVVVNNSLILSSNNLLESVIVGNDKHVFQANEDTYSVDVNYLVDKINLSATLKDSKSSVIGTGNKELIVGKNLFEIKVTAEDGNEKIYKVIVNRIDDRSSDNKLDSLKISNGTISFNKDVNNYVLTVKNDVTSINITAVAHDEKAVITGVGKVDLDVYSNTIEVVVTAENGSKNTYVLTVNREDQYGNIIELPDDNSLSDLTIDGYKIVFKSDVLIYSIEVENDVTSIDVKAIANDSKASVVVNNSDNLAVGKNVVTVNVVAQNGSSRTYKINVTRKDKIKGEIDNPNDTNKNGNNKDKIVVTSMVVICIGLLGFTSYSFILDMKKGL